MTQKQLRRFLEVMVDNLVDSNVFMRSLVLSVEHSAFREDFREDLAPRLVPSQAGFGTGLAGEEQKGATGDRDDGGDGGGSLGLEDGEDEPCYLGHTWYDVQPRVVEEGLGFQEDEKDGEGEDGRQGLASAATAASRSGLVARFSWMRDNDRGAAAAVAAGGAGVVAGGSSGEKARAGEDRVRVATTAALSAPREEGAASGVRGETLRAAGSRGEARTGKGLTRLQCFLKQNTRQLVRDLMGVVNLETINHENICCLNTAVLILIFADRRGQLAEVRKKKKKMVVFGVLFLDFAWTGWLFLRVVCAEAVEGGSRRERWVVSRGCR